MEPLEARIVLTGDILISEFMAVNNTTLNDEDGSSRDWIELFNNSTEPVNIGGWYLSDDAEELTKWQFPDVTIGPDEFMVVFASDKDRTDPNSELHTNFKLTSAGEYLGLIQSDGVTRSHEYGTLGGEVYPQQLADVSYGVEQTTLDYSFVADGAEVGVLIPTSAAEDLPAATWTAAGFNDGSWSTHNLGVGFDGGGELLGELSGNGDLGADMQGNSSSAYVRSEFNIAGAVPEMDALTMNINFDDGYIAYLNGVEVASSNAPASRDWSTQATQSHGGELVSVDFDGFNDEDLRNLFTLNGHSQFVGNRLQVTGTSSASRTGATWLTEPLAFGSNYTFSTAFEIDVHSPGGISFLEAPDDDGNGGQGMTFVLQAGSPFRLGGGRGELGLDNAGMAFVAVEFDTFGGGGAGQSFDDGNSPPTHIGIDTSVDGSIVSVGVPRFNGGAQGDNPRFVWVDYDGVTDTMDVYFSETAGKPAQPTLSATVDLPALFGAEPLWAGFTGATSFNWNSHDVLDFEITTFSSELGLTTETVDLTEHIGLLQSGQNVLAIHGLNLNANDDDFLVDATLFGALNNVTFTDQLAYFTVPTPGEPNGSGSERPASSVEFSVSGRTFTGSITVELDADDPDAVIRYTTDGTLPTEFSNEYAGPMTVTDTTRFRARAFEDGLAPGPVQTQSYIELAPDVANFEGGVFQSNLPIFVLDSFGDGGANSDGTNFHGATALVFDVGADGVASLAAEPDTVEQLGVRIRGQSSQGWPKKQYALEFWDESIDYTGAIDGKDGPDKGVRLLDLPSESDWVLQGPYSDKTQLNNWMAFNLYRDLGQSAPRVRLVEAFVNVNGGTVDMATDYRGTYILLEKNKIDNNRVDIPDPISNPVVGQDPTTVGGYIFKQDKSSPPEVVFNTTGHGRASIPLRFQDPDEPNAAQQAWLSGFVNEFEAVLNGNDFADPVNGYAKYIDMDSWVDHWLITEMAREIDGYRISEYFFLNREGKIEKGPAWDFNLSFSNANYLEGGRVDGFYMDDIGGAQPHWYPRLFEDPAFESRVHDRWFELRQDEFSWENLESMIDEGVEKLTNGSPNFDNPAPGEPSNPISRNYDRWNVVGSYLWPNCFFPGNSPAAHCRDSPLPPEMSPNGAPNSYDDYIFIMKDFVVNRLDWIDNEFGKPPAFDPPGGIVSANTQVTLTTDQSGTIYYTTDGTDPQQQQQIVETEHPLIDAGAAASIIVPADSTLMDACANGSIFLPNHQNCFISPNYTEGTHGETWIAGNSGIGFGFPEVNTDIQGEAQGTNASAYMRIPFEVTAEDRSNMTALTLNVRYEDGFSAYLWQNALNIPVEVVSQNAPENSPTSGFPIAPADFDDTALSDRDDALASNFVSIDISNRRGNLVVGTNYLVLQALNDNAGDDTMLLDVELTYTTESIALPGNVIEYTSPITVDENMVITARTYDEPNDKWSSRSSQSYFVTVPPIRVTELNYNPAEPTQAEIDALYGGVVEDADNDDFEFIEIMNVGSDLYPLTGVTISDAVDYTFESGSLAAGERGVLVRNQTAFELRYGAGINILGSWADDPDNPAPTDRKLNNDGEHVLIQGPLGEPTMDFTYNDVWYPLTDGSGFTLVIADPNADPGTWSAASSWRPSDFLNGSPGAGDAGLAPVHGSVIVNEVVANSSAGNDAIELRNTTGNAVDIGSFFLTDDPTNLEKFVVPAGTVVPANGYTVIDTNDIGGFALTDTGGRIVLQAANAAGVHLGFQTDRRFDAAFPDTSEGVYTTSLGNVDFVSLTSVTLGAANAGPTIGPVVINEIMYNPPIGEPEWFELKNISNSTVELGADLWVVVEGIDYAFPAGATLAPGGFAVLVQSTDGGDAQAAADAFRADNNVPASVSIYVYEPTANGTLDNAGEDIAIGRKLDVGLPGAVRFELIEYDNADPWPTEPDGTGSSLTRIDSTTYGNEPGNWGVGGLGGTPGEDSTFQDLTPPTMPTDVHGNLEPGGEIVIAWGPSVDSESGVDHYNIYRDGNIVGTSPYARFAETVVFTSAPIVYRVSAVNGDGVESTISDTSVDFSALSLNFQEGVDGYTGGADLEIRTGTGASTAGVINVDGDDSGVTYGLLRWDNLTAVPAGGVIVGIEIQLSVVDNAYSTYQAQQLLRPWDEGTATWTDSGFGPWDAAGATGAGDVGAVVGDIPGSSNGVIDVNAAGVAMVQSWIDNPAENYGIALNEPPGGGTDGLDFYSRENGNPDLNPRLTILFMQPPTASDLGDLDVDGTFDVDDINLLVQGIQNGATDSAFDIDGSGTVDTNDIAAWLSVAGNANIGTPYVPGDADLDGDVDAADLNTVGINWQQNVAGWSQADFNADGIVSANDLNAIGLNWQHGVAAAAAGRVPRAPLAAKVDAAHAIPADAVIPREITTPETQPLRTESVTPLTEGAIERDEVTLTRYQTRNDSHRLVSGQQDDSERKDVFTDLADDIFAAW